MDHLRNHCTYKLQKFEEHLENYNESNQTLSFSEYVENEDKRAKLNEEASTSPRREVLRNVDWSYETFQKRRDGFANEGSAQWHESVSIIII